MKMEIKTEDAQNSIKIAKNSKGYTWEIKRYFTDAEENTLEVLEWLKATDKALKEQYDKDSLP